MPDNTELLHAYSDYISTFPWDYYATVTFRPKRKDGSFCPERHGAVPGESATESSPRCDDALWWRAKDHLYWYPRIWRWLEKFDCTRAFIACERHKRDGIHYHILSRHLSTSAVPLSTTSIWRYAFKAFGRSRVSPITDTLRVSRYCSKYVVKGNQFEFCGDGSAWMLDH